MRRQLLRMYSVVFPCVNLKIVFKPVYKLSCVSKLKSQYPLLSSSNVIYKVNCASCNEFYVGLTTRRLEQRLKEHSSSENSALFRHAMDTGHTIDICNPEVLASDVISRRLRIKETLIIKDHSAHRSLNGNQGSYELKLW